MELEGAAERGMIAVYFFIWIAYIIASTHFVGKWNKKQRKLKSPDTTMYDFLGYPMAWAVGTMVIMAAYQFL